MTTDPSGRPFRVLVVCTANQCRSPLGEVILRDALFRHGVDAVVVSAGTMQGAAGMPAARGSRKVAKELGLELEQHVSHEVDADTVAAADLVITMGVSHVMDLATRFDGCHDKTLTLRELVAHVTSSEVNGPLTLDQVQAEVAAACDRPLSALLGGHLDVDDPIGMPTSRFRKTGAELTELVEVVAAAWFPVGPV
ncbi:MAG: hypothetical protein ACKO04_06105 [Actinomycetes bacterium]